MIMASDHIAIMCWKCDEPISVYFSDVDKGIITTCRACGSPIRVVKYTLALHEELERSGSDGDPRNISERAKKLGASLREMMQTYFDRKP